MGLIKENHVQFALLGSAQSHKEEHCEDVPHISERASRIEDKASQATDLLLHAYQEKTICLI